MSVDRRIVEDALVRLEEIARLCREHGDTANADFASDVAAKAAIELAFLDCQPPPVLVVHRLPPNDCTCRDCVP